MIFKHPSSVCMSYISHMKLSFSLSFLFFKASICAFIHAIIPDILITSSTDVNNTVSLILKNNGCHSKR